ncbi:MAG: hypothetical protein IKP64_07740 [Selenomonadaceae bacterium]|nr:hypothetical protein [Selenomonadaceae bacterium]MBR4383434.1 hypothetical protein [Selenomonadaceae bacterium]
MTVEDRFASVDFSQFSRVKDSLLLKLKLRRQAINEERNEEMSLEELDYVAAAGVQFPQKKLDENNQR